MLLIPEQRRASSGAVAQWPPTRQPAIHPAERACCCRAAVRYRVLLPPAAAGSRSGDLLLCDRHLRAGRAALAGAGAAAYDVRGQRFPLGLALEPLAT